MNRQPYSKPPRWWSPKLSRWWIRFWRRVRLREQVIKHRLVEVEARGLEHVQKAVGQGNGVLITPNHCSHADAFALYGAADALGIPFYVMVAWQVFARSNRFRQLALRQHGCFSVDREGTDVNAIRQARDVLMSATCPLVIFPEGEVYHVNDRVMLFREGPAGIALMAAKKAARPVVCVPCAIKYRYLEDPTPELTRLMARLEQALFWRPRPDLSLPQRIYHLAEGMLALEGDRNPGSNASRPAARANSQPDRIRALPHRRPLRAGPSRRGNPRAGEGRVAGPRSIAWEICRRTIRPATSSWRIWTTCSWWCRASATRATTSPSSQASSESPKPSTNSRRTC